MERTFLNEEFFENIFETFNSSNLKDSKENDSDSLLGRILEFSRECYIHGVKAGINAAISIYESEDENKDRGK